MDWAEYTTEGAVRLHVRRVEGGAQAILFSHGLGVTGAVFQNFARRLLPHLGMVAPDLRGHGQSDAPPSGYAPADYAHDIIELLEAEGPMPVAGHSLGAMVALETASLRPDRVPWLVLLDPPLDPDFRNQEIGDVYKLRHAPPGELEAYLQQRNPGGGPLLAQALAKMFRQASDAAFEPMLSHAPFEIPHVSQRTLVLQADPRAGGVLGDAAAARLLEALPNATLIKVVGAPHALHASHPAEVANAILEFAGYRSGVSSPSA